MARSERDSVSERGGSGVWRSFVRGEGGCDAHGEKRLVLEGLLDNVLEVMRVRGFI